MKHWQFYIALLLLAIFALPKLGKEYYTDRNLNDINQSITKLITESGDNISYINRLINTPMNDYPEINKIPLIPRYTGPSNFIVFLVNKDIESIYKHIMLLQNTLRSTAYAINKILSLIDLDNNAILPTQQLRINNSYYTNVQIYQPVFTLDHDPKRFFENDLVILKEDIAQLQRISEINQLLYVIITNQIGIGSEPLPPDYVPPPLNPPSIPQPLFTAPPDPPIPALRINPGFRGFPF